MGRFYETVAPEFVDDAMFKLPYEQMGAVLLAKDEKVGSDIEATTALGELLKAQGLKVDEPRVNEKIKQYEDKIQQNVDYIRGNVLNYDPTELSKLKREINEDWTRGEIAAIQGNKAAYEKDLALWREMQKKEPEKYNDNYINTLAEQSLKRYQGIGYEGPSKYNTYSGLDATAMPDMNKWVDEALKDAIPDFKSVSKEVDTGKWLVKTGTSTKEMTDKDINEILQTRLGGDPNLQMALKQRSEFGLEGFTDLFDEEGNLKPTIGFGEKGQTLFANNILGNSFKSGIEKYGFKETTSTRDMQANPYALKDYDYALAKKKEQEDAEFITVTDTNNVPTFTGNGAKDFKDKRLQFYATKKNLIENAMTMAMKNFGYTSLEEFKNKRPKTFEHMQAGNFKASGVNLPEMQVLQSALKDAEFEEKVRMAAIETFKKDNGGKFDLTKPDQMKKWNDFLLARAEQPTDVKIGWGHFQGEDAFTASQVKSVQTQAAPLIPNAIFKMKPGTTVTINGKKVDISKYSSLNEMVQAGLVTIEQVKNGEGLTGGVATENGVVGQQVTAVFKDGKTRINFDLSANSLQPVFGASNSGKVDFQVTGNIAGQTFTARLPEIGSEKVDSYNAKNQKTHKGIKKMAQIGRGTVEINEFATYHGDDGNKEVMMGAKNYNPNMNYKKGWIEVKDSDGTYEIHSIHNEPEYYEALINILGE